MRKPWRRRNREEEGRGSTVAPGLIDGTIWKRREAGSLMSLRIDEDKMGPGSRGNNLWGFMLLLMGRVPGSGPPLIDGFPTFPSIRLRLPSAAEMRKGRSTASLKGAVAV